MPEIALTPDGARYFALAAGRRLPAPFRLRWLAPMICRRSLRRWQALAWGSWVATGVGVAVLAPTWQQAAAAGLMAVALPAARFNLRRPVLVDAPAMAFAVWAAVCWQEGLWPLGVVLILLSGAVKETGPVFGALYAWTPWLLVGLVAPLVRAVASKPGADVLDAENAWILTHPLQASRKYHQGHWLDGLWMLTPWGGAIAALGAVTPHLVVCLAVAYGQLLVATDTVRLYQWAAPVVCLAAVGAVPPVWLPLLVIVTVWNPLAGNGV